MNGLISGLGEAFRQQLVQQCENYKIPVEKIQLDTQPKELPCLVLTPFTLRSEEGGGNLQWIRVEYLAVLLDKTSSEKSKTDIVNTAFNIWELLTSSNPLYVGDYIVAFIECQEMRIDNTEIASGVACHWRMTLVVENPNSEGNYNHSRFDVEPISL